MPFFTKQEIMQRMAEKRACMGDVGSARADLNLALIILGCALFEKRLWSGRDYGEHPLHVGMSNTRSAAKVIIGLLHDVVEDSDWTIDDLRAVGFSERIVSAVDAMTHRNGELYYDSIERCSLNPDALDKKIEDLSHNQDSSRSEIFLQAADVDRINKYVIARAYLVAIKKELIAPGSPVRSFVSGRSDLCHDPVSATLIARHSKALPGLNP